MKGHKSGRRRLGSGIILAAAWYCFGSGATVLGQGCMCVRGGGQSAAALLDSQHAGGYLDSGDWLISESYRWLYADRHFVGSKEFTVPKERDAEAINNQHFVDLAVQRGITERFSVGLTFPFSYATRSTTYEHDNVNRHKTEAGGLGDIRLSGYYLLFDPAETPAGNVLVGMGLKFPTGEYDAEDTFYSSHGPVRAPVDQSIQPGDGGYGFTLELYGARRLVSDLSAYAQGSYLLNPENENGVSTTTGTRFGNPYEQTMSIPDQYLARVGLSYELIRDWGLSASLGGRMEGVMKKDLIGGNDGFRRPGCAISVEPGIGVVKNDWFFLLTVPVAVYRNRLRSVADERLYELRGEYHHGDAAFADYVITCSLARQF